jgi:CheY-like chemotaxis protein
MESSEETGGRAPAAAAEKASVLIVEDHPVNQKLFALVLEKLGHEAVIANDGQEAVDLVAAGPSIWFSWTSRCPG